MEPIVESILQILFALCVVAGLAVWIRTMDQVK